MSKVFVIKQAMMRKLDIFVPQHDLSPALEYGPIITMFDGHEYLPYDGDVLLGELERRFASYNMREDDYLLLIGDPLAIAIGTVAALNVAGKIQLLKWDRQAKRYLPYSIKQPE